MMRLLISTGAIITIYFGSYALGLMPLAWIDIPYHLAGGMWLAAVSLYLRPQASAFSVAGFIIVGGILWEIVEYILALQVPWILPGFQYYEVDLLDLYGDLMTDLIGGMLALWWWRR